MILGAALTVGIAYVHDSGRAEARMVNWEIVKSNVDELRMKAQTGWSELRARIEKS
jgi:ATP-dependent Clp protease adapter protein ClpS